MSRFGQDRCEHGQATGRLVLADAGGDPVPRPGETVLVHVDAFSDADAAELEELDRDFGEWLREGTVILDGDGYESLFEAPPPGYAEIMGTPGRPATGLAPSVATAQLFGLVEMPGHLDDDYERWVDLQTRAGVDDVTILLAPPSPVEDPGGPASTPSPVRTDFADQSASDEAEYGSTETANRKPDGPIARPHDVVPGGSAAKPAGGEASLPGRV